MDKLWPLTSVGLRVQDIEKESSFYQALGFTLLSDTLNLREEREIALGVEGREIVRLRELHEGKIRDAHSAGLYHFALLLPNEEKLGSFLQHAIDTKISLDGAADHLVSQALYLHDPEGNGIEVYADRPKNTWKWQEGAIRMDTVALNAHDLLAKADSFTLFPESLVLGHMHLNVGNLDQSSHFFQDLDLELTADYYEQARFLSWDQYHHHLGLNLWNGKGAKPIESNTYGIDYMSIKKESLPKGVLTDVNGIEVRNEE